VSEGGVTRLRVGKDGGVVDITVSIEKLHLKRNTWKVKNAAESSCGNSFSIKYQQGNTKIKFHDSTYLFSSHAQRNPEPPIQSSPFTGGVSCAKLASKKRKDSTFPNKDHRSEIETRK
jgi:hypothetical protein